MDIKVGRKAIEEASKKLSNWGRWGKDDHIGTLNHVTPEDIANAAKLIKTGKVFALGIPLDREGPQNGLFGGRFNPIHQMLATGTDAVAGQQDWNKLRYADDTLNLCVQGATHWDALGHVFYEDKAYNGHDAKLIDSRGLSVLGIEHSKSRMVGRGVLLDIARFWLDRGVDGFRVDVAHGLVKTDGLPDHLPAVDADSMGGGEENVPYWGQEGVHEIYRDWHRVLAEYDGDRALCAEAWLPTVDRTAEWVRPEEMHQAFNFPYLMTEWEAPAIREVIAESLRAFPAVGAPATWVLSNHDVVRHASRLALTAENPQGHGIGPSSPGQPIPEVGLRRARAATTVMLALPGSAYIYQGEELGLPEVIELPGEVRQDPTWFRTDGERYGRDGCRVPLPWSGTEPPFGFTTGRSWLPLPPELQLVG